MCGFERADWNKPQGPTRTDCVSVLCAYILVKQTIVVYCLYMSELAPVILGHLDAPVDLAD